MYVLFAIFAASLFLIALFFAVKEREVYSGTDTWLTRLLRRHSPAAQARARTAGAWMLRHLRILATDLDHAYETAVHALVWGLRVIIVALAQRMIHIVRGEQLLSMKSASSMYLKHLKDHKDSVAGDAPQV